VLLLIWAGLRISSVVAQPYWVNQVGGTGNDLVSAVRTATDGSIYVTGEFSGSITLGGNTFQSTGSLDAFVAKLGQAGDLIWFTQAGGSGIDRGLKVDVSEGGVVAWVGEFLGTMTIGAQQLVSAGGTSDMFIASLSAATGAVQWVRKGGGAAGTDRPNGVSIAPDGTMCVVGEFRGNASWGSITRSSETDPGTGAPSTDVFIARYTADGSELWVEQGAAPFADRAVDVVHDGTGSIYVTGQFSDTITFDQTHNNILLNASFLIRFDPAGNEQWFRRFGGAGFNHVRDLELTAAGDLVLTGDQQGTMVFSGTTPVNIGDALPNAYYVLRVSTAGALLDHATVGSTSSVQVSSLAVSGNEVSVLGVFRCQFNDLATFYGGNGLFMGVGDEDLFIARHRLADLNLLEAQQFGGRSAKTSTGLAYVKPTDLVFTGGYQSSLIFPSVTGFTGDIQTPSSGLIGNGVSSYCGDASYGRFAGILSEGVVDGFVARGYVNGREPYDFWRRTGSDCNRDTMELCIRQQGADACTDTIRSCGSTVLNVLTPFSHSTNANANYLGPALTYQWSNGSTASQINASTSGTYSVTVTSVNGCYQWTDAVVVIILQLPPSPLVSDDVVVNTASAAPGLIELCDPETAWAWVTNVGSGTSFSWSDEFGNVFAGADSVLVDTSGTYTFTVIAANGCQRTVSVEVEDRPSVPLPDIAASLVVSFPGDTDLNDTLTLCPVEPAQFTFIPSWTVNGWLVDSLPEGLTVTWSLAPNEPTTVLQGAVGSGALPTVEGWIYVSLIVQVSNKPCLNDSVRFTQLDSIYVDLYPASSVDLQLVGPSVLCDGQTAILSATCDLCEDYLWIGSGFTQLSPDSILVNAPGNYSVSGGFTDSNGCSFGASASLVITSPSSFTISANPADGIICPNSSATLSTAGQGTGHIWYGPQGPITGQGPTLVTNVPGEYYLTMSVGGCEVTSNPVALSNYGTPFLSVPTPSALCGPGDELILQVVAVPGAVITWGAPFFTDDASQTVTEAGTYTVSVTACGIETALSATIISDPATISLLTPGPYVLCAGEAVELLASTANASLTWLPGNTSGPGLTVSSAGVFQAVAVNASGCSDSTAVVTVEQVLFPDPVIVPDTSICAGNALLLVATGSGPVVWYADPDLTTTLGTGPTLSLTPQVSTVVYVQQQDQGCIGSLDAAAIDVRPSPAPVLVTGDAALCLGEDLLLTANVNGATVLTWTTPVGSVEGASVFLEAPPITAAGVYTATPVLGTCTGASVPVIVAINAPQPLVIPSVIELCDGDAARIVLPEGFSNVAWSNGATSNVLDVSVAGAYTVRALDMNDCAAQAEVLVVVGPCDLIIPNVFSPNGDAWNEGWLAEGGFVQARATIHGRWGNLVFEGDLVSTNWDGRHYRSQEPCPEGVYYYVIDFERSDGRRFDRAGYLHLLR
jgi:gliding motility-associated-like protein